VEDRTLSVIVKEILELRMKISPHQNRIRATIYCPKVMTKKQILVKTRTLNLGLAKSRAKWKLW